MSILASLSLLSSCSKDNDAEVLACGLRDPIKELNWLSELVQKADADTTGHYFGTIYLERVDDKDAFFVEMAMGSGAIMGGMYNCEGNKIEFDPSRLKRDRIIYSNLP